MSQKIFILMSIAFYIAIMAACQDSKAHSRTPKRLPAEVTTAYLRIQVPGPSVFPMNSGAAGDYLNSYLLRVATDSNKCADAQVYELKDYNGADTVSLEVDTSCSFKVRFAIGKENKASNLQQGNLALDVFYTTDEPFEVHASDLAKGDVSIRLHLKRTALGEKIGFSNLWAKDDLSSVDENTDQGDSSEDQSEDQEENVTIQVNYADLKGTIDSSCASCHRPGGSRSQSDLSTYDGFKRHGATAVARIMSGSMPPRPMNPLASDVIKKFTDWQKAGFPEKSSNTQDTTSNTDVQRVVEFRIRSGTGSGTWNTQNAPVNLKVGQILRIINEDTIRHRLHTDGAPCPHGNDIPPGGSEDCVISRPFTSGNLYDHNNLGRFFIRAER